MRESSVVQSYMDEAKTQGIEQGREEGTIESILTLLGNPIPS